MFVEGAASLQQPSRRRAVRLSALASNEIEAREAAIANALQKFAPLVADKLLRIEVPPNLTRGGRFGLEQI
jgi:hypothetical protein